MRAVLYAVLFLLVVGGAFAAPTVTIYKEHNLSGSFTGTDPTFFGRDIIEDDYFVTMSYTPGAPIGNAYSEIFQISNGNKVYGQTTSLFGAGSALYTGNNYAVTTYQKNGNQGGFNIIDVGTPGFFALDFSWSAGAKAPTNSFVSSHVGNEIGVWFYDGGTNTPYYYVFNTVNDNTSYEIAPTGCNLRNLRTVDTDNRVYAAGSGGASDFYRYEENPPTANCSVIHTPSSNVVTWNRDPDNPKYLLSGGHLLVVTGNYTTFQQSGGTYDTSLTPIAWFSDSIIIAHNNTHLWNIDFSDPATPTEETIGLEWDNTVPSNYRKDAPQYQNRFLGFDVSTATATFYEVELPSNECEINGGCYLNDTFEYTDTVLNHGWTGNSVIPSGGLYECAGATYQQNEYFIIPVTDATGTVQLDFQLNFCAGSGHEFYVSMGDGGVTGWSLALRDDGNWYDWQGDDVGDFNVTCNASNTHNVSVRVYMQNSPRSYDLFVDGVLESSNNPFTTQGQLVNELEWVIITSNVFSDFCDWSLDSITLFDYDAIAAAAAGDGFNQSAANLATARTWGCFITGGDDAGFDTSNCRPDEDMNLCFLRCNAETIGNWLWRTATSNILIVLAFLLVFGVVVIARRT